MSHSVFNLDDFVGLIPFLSILGFLLFQIGRLISFLLSLPLKIARRSKPATQVAASSTPPDGVNDDDADAASDAADGSAPPSTDHEMSLPAKSIVFLLALSYFLAPLSTLFHLQGKRLNVDQHRDRNLTASGSPFVFGAAYRFSGLFDFVQGKDPKLNELVARMPSLLRGPKPPLLFANRHLQFLPWLIQNEIHRQEGIPYQRIEFQVTACLDKTKPQGALMVENCERSPLMNDTITLDVFPPFDADDNNDNQKYTSQGFHSGSPILFISPGLRCYSQDIPGTMIVRRAFGAGFRTIVMNRRGHTPDKPLKAPRWNLFGDVDELEQVYWHIYEHYAAPHTPYLLHGISSGTAVVVSALSEFDRRRSEGHDRVPSFVGSVSVTPGYDISKVMLPDRFKFPYNPILTESVKDHFIRQNEDVLRQFDSHAVTEALAATNLQELLNAAAPFAGYPNATAYFWGENPVNDMHHVTTPKLVLNSIDDPCCNVHNIYEQSPYPQHEGRTYAQIVADSPRGLLAVTTTGTHCPFLDSTEGATNYILPSLLPSIVPDPFNDGWMLDSWADRVSIEFYQAALEVYGEERRYMQ